MGQGGSTGERLAMEAAKPGNDIPVVDEIDLCIARMECLCLLYFQPHYLMLPHCSLGGVVCHAVH
jgi:hypothetical protein